MSIRNNRTPANQISNQNSRDQAHHVWSDACSLTSDDTGRAVYMVEENGPIVFDWKCCNNIFRLINFHASLAGQSAALSSLNRIYYLFSNLNYSRVI